MKRTNILLALASMLLFAACKKNDAPQTLQYQLVADSSRATWRGYLRTGYFNEGSILVESQNIQVTNGKVESGSFQMPLSGLKNFNLPTDSLKELLIHHLQSPDFFNMALHPNLSFKIGAVTGYSGGVPGAVAGANYTVKGELSILGKPLEISFPARISISGNKLYVAASLKVDRTRWGMTYASDPALPDEQYIMPEMAIELNLQGIRK